MKKTHYVLSINKTYTRKNNLAERNINLFVQPCRKKQRLICSGSVYSSLFNIQYYMPSENDNKVCITLLICWVNSNIPIPRQLDLEIQRSI